MSITILSAPTSAPHVYEESERTGFLRLGDIEKSQLSHRYPRAFYSKFMPFSLQVMSEVLSVSGVRLNYLPRSHYGQGLKCLAIMLSTLLLRPCSILAEFSAASCTPPTGSPLPVLNS